MKYLCLLLISLPAFGQFGAASRILSGTGAPVAAQCTVENNVGLVWARKDGADAGTTFYVCGATGVGTYGWELRGGAPGGASALTTVGSVPFVTTSGVLGQNTNFRFFNGTGNLVVGTTTDDGSSRLQVNGNLIVNGGNALRLQNAAGNQFASMLLNANSIVTVNYPFSVGPNSTLTSAVTFGVHDGTPTTGSTSLVVRAGAGQGGNRLFDLRRPDNSLLGSHYAYSLNDVFIADVWYSSNNNGMAILPEAIQISSNSVIEFLNGTITAVNSSTKDLAARRRAAGLLSLDSGTAIGTTPGNARDIMLRRTFAAETTTDPSAADLTIAGSNTQDVAAIYVKNDKLVVAYNRSGTVNYLTIPLDGATTTFTQSTTAP